MTLLSKLNHPNIITLYELFSHNGKYYVVMEYCRGGTIIEILDRLRKKSESLIAQMVKQLMSALAYMHSLNIIHRDIKLDNIVFVARSEDCIAIKIIDFGTAVQTKHKLIHNYPIAGTLSYLAPEVLSEVLTEKSDVWSSAVLLYILLTGVAPFKGKD
jgi:calcium-dependent protein kinase